MKWSWILLLAGVRFMALALITSEIEAVLTQRIPYNSWRGAIGLILAGILWALGDAVTKESRK